MAFAALIRLLAWELPYVTGSALKREKKKKKKNGAIRPWRLNLVAKNILCQQRNWHYRNENLCPTLRIDYKTSKFYSSEKPTPQLIFV